MDELLHMYSQNCRGLNSVEKRRDLFQYVRQKKYDIICLQDVHLVENMEPFIKSEWGYHLYMSPFRGNQRGVMILINNTFEYEIGKIVKDPNGNFIIVELTISDKRLSRVNIYGPNDDKPQFYRTLHQHVLDLNNEYVIFCGDWNFVLDPNLDTENYKSINNPRARSTVLKIIDENEYIDVWRTLNDNKKQFTWRRLNPEKNKPG